MATVFYGTMSISEDLADNLEFKPIWQAALDSYDEDKLEWGITSVYGQDPEDGQVVYTISGSTPGSFDDEVATCLCGSLSVAQAGELMEQLEAQKAVISFESMNTMLTRTSSPTRGARLPSQGAKPCSPRPPMKMKR